jgi:hypothetical protein
VHAFHRFPDGQWLDHVAWAVPDTGAGVAQLRELTGAAIDTPPAPESGQWYLSAGLPLGEGRFLEVIGPAPGVHGHPFADLLRSLPGPRLLFWYVRVVDWDAAAALAESAGWPLSRIEEVDDPQFHSYRRAALGPDLDPVVPNVIEWRRRRSTWRDDADCAVERFTVGHPDHESIATRLAAIGILLDVVHDEQPALRLELRTPNGSVRLEGLGNPLHTP